MTDSTFFGFTTDGWLSNARTILKVAGTIAVTLGVSDAAHLDAVTDAILNIAGSVSVVAGFFWSLWHHAPADVVAPATPKTT